MADKEKEFNGEETLSSINKQMGLEYWKYNIIRFGISHLFAVYWLYLQLTGQAPSSVIICQIIVGYIGGIGVTVGTHRYWTHKSFKAKLPLQILLMIMQTVSFHDPIHLWTSRHRIHHQFTDTAADPHNSKRGFWFCHIGWKITPASKEFEEKLRTVDVKDLDMDPVVRFQSRWYFPLVMVFHFAIPISIMYYIWNMPLIYCFAANCCTYVGGLHATFTVNSVAHMWGYKPYDRNISSTENPIVSLLAAGEGWHNYHHTFPWDYKAAELGWKINASTMFIDLFAYIGWAYDMKTVSQELLRNRLARTGNESHSTIHNNSTEYCGNEYKRECYGKAAEVTELLKPLGKLPWGWGDENIPYDLRQATIILRPEQAPKSKMG